MYAFVVLVGLALALAVVGEVLEEVLPVTGLRRGTHRALTTTLSVGVAIALAWALDWSVFRAFGQPLRSAWMNPVVTGLVLVGAGELIRSVVVTVTAGLPTGRRSGVA